MRVAGRGGPDALAFMVGHFVFYWPEHSRMLTVSHGTLAGPKMPLWNDIAIDEDWSPERLTWFARAWTRDHLARFRLP